MHPSAPGRIEGVTAMQSTLASRNISNFIQVTLRYGGWSSNPRPADYEKPGPALRAHYLHGYHGAVPPMALIALLARVTRPTIRSTAKRRHPPSYYGARHRQERPAHS
jgi:hypothetical protein